MRRMIWALVFLVLAVCLSGAALGEENVYHGSDEYWEGHVAVVDGRVYCINPSVPGGQMSSRWVYEVTTEGLVPVWRGGKLDEIYACGSQLLLVSMPQRPYIAIKGMSDPDREVDVLDLRTGETIRCDAYERKGASGHPRLTFAANGRVYTLLPEDGRGRALQVYDGAERVEVSRSLAKWPARRTFLLVTHTARGALRGDVWNLSVYDYRTGEVLDIRRPLTLPRGTRQAPDLCATLRGTVLYYLSRDGVRACDAATNEDRLIAAVSPEEVRDFVVTEGEVWVFAQENEASMVVGYDLTTGECIAAWPYSLYVTDPVIYDGVLYNASPVNVEALEVIDLATGETRLLPFPE